MTKSNSSSPSPLQIAYATNITGCASSDASSSDFWVGVVSAVFGSIILNFGLNIQKLAFVKLARLPPAKRVKVYCFPLWIFGFIVFAIGNAGDAIGLAFTAQSIITPIGSVSLVSNLVFAWLLVGESLDRVTVSATLLIVLGVVMIVASGDQRCTNFTLEALMSRFRQSAFLTFASLHALGLGAMIIFLYYQEKIIENDGVVAVTGKSRSLMRLAYPVAGSFCAAWTVLLMKSFGELLKRSWRSGSSEFLKIESWLITIGMFLSFPMQLIYLQKGLSRFESMYIIPVFTSSWTVSSIAMGGVFWGAFKDFLGWQITLFSFGVLCIICGVLGLQKRKIRLTPKVSPEAGIDSEQDDKEHGDLALVTTSVEAAKEVLSRPHGGVGSKKKNMHQEDEDVPKDVSRQPLPASRLMTHVLSNLHPLTHRRVVEKKNAADDDNDELEMSMNTAVREITRNASFFTVTAGALAKTTGGPILAQTSSNVGLLQSS